MEGTSEETVTLMEGMSEETVSGEAVVVKRATGRVTLMEEPSEETVLGEAAVDEHGTEGAVEVRTPVGVAPACVSF